MNIWKKKILLLLPLMTLTVFVSCVGTVKDYDPKESDSTSGSGLGSSTAISFDGLLNATAIASNKIELKFQPADGASEIIYEIYVNNSSIPIKLNGSSLSTDPSGNYRFTVKGLSPNTTYSFNMQAIPAGGATTNKLDADKSLSATTFNNQTADFLGISNLALGAGSSGKTSVTLSWIPATITGTTTNVRETDPVQYEITYISQLGGAANLNQLSYTGVDRVVIKTPPTLNSPPALNKEKEYTISGLTSGMTYYFQVRAIHKGFITYSADLQYKREINSNFMSIKTLSTSGVFDFNPTQVLISHPLGEPGLKALDVSWTAAVGDYDHYRLCFAKVANPNAGAPTTDLIADAWVTANIINAAVCPKLEAKLSNTRLTDLTQNAYYQVKVVACKTSSCPTADQIRSLYKQSRVFTNIAQFSGLESISNPLTDTTLDSVQVSFSPPIVSSGYLTELRLYCHAGPTDKAPGNPLPTNGSPSSGYAVEKSHCNGLTVMSAWPTSLSDFGVFANFTLKIGAAIDGSKTYCFSLVPIITSTNLFQTSINAAVIKCVTPNISTPNLIEFPGKNPVCDSPTGKNLNITWPSPSGGLYSKFAVFYREKNSGTDFFSFNDALIAYNANNTSSPYKWVDNINKISLSHDILSLIPGKTYSVGVLPYLINGATKIFSFPNLNVDDCALPLPAATFNEWVDIFAVGPKEDGLVPIGASGRTYILETLDDDDIPVEIKLDQSDEKTPDVTNAFALARMGEEFSGVFGAKDANLSNTGYQYSNSGIIRIAWKDVTFFGGTPMRNYINSASDAAKSKSDRQYGYKVYRSSDNQISWVDLTKHDAIKNKMQTPENAGLLHPKMLNWKSRNNDLATISEQVVSFIDYSVKFSGTNGEIDRARTYWYKIVPVFNGKEVPYDIASNKSHHIIRVTLPPRNMALVHRLMANRTICLEMDKNLRKGENENYSCDYNGLGAVGKVKPAAEGQTIYDLGSDLLIDRFELSCPLTRGDENILTNDSAFGGTKLNFTGFSTTNPSNPFKGCFNDSSPNYEPKNGAYTPTADYRNHQIRPGDCFGNEIGFKASNKSTVCTDKAKTSSYSYIYPGSGSVNFKDECADIKYLGPDMSNLNDSTSFINNDDQLTFPTQSEFAAIYYMRGMLGTSSYSYTNNQYPGANDKTINFNGNGNHRPNSCTVNLPYVNSNGQYRPRWIPLNAIFDKLSPSDDSAKTLSLYDKTIDQIINHDELYDGTTVNNPAVKAPPAELLISSRYNAQSTLARVMTSNSSKLPSVTGLSQNDFQKLCSTYKVQVGVETASKGFVKLSTVQSKRLMRKTESTVAAAWPSTYPQIKVTNIEKGTYTEGTSYLGCNGPSRIIDNANNSIKGVVSLVKGGIITPNFSQANKTRSPIFNGSSNLDLDNYSTQKCVSRFGVQDIVGNHVEVNSDQIFCDFTTDKMFIAASSEHPYDIIPYNGEIIDPDQVHIVVKSTDESGSCSLVENGAYRDLEFATNGIINDIYTTLGLNSLTVAQAKNLDQDSILMGRNGDGSFLDFGQLNLGVKLNITDSLDISKPDGESNYFSIPWGIPLKCPDEVCTDSINDNRLFTADALSTAKSWSAGNNPSSIPNLNFPVNNSTFTNQGTAETEISYTYDTKSLDTPESKYINGIDLGDDLEDASDNLALEGDYIPGTGTPTYLLRYNFSVARGVSLKMYTGGAFDQEPGRYSLNISGVSDETDRLNERNISSRCAISINQE